MHTLFIWLPDCSDLICGDPLTDLAYRRQSFVQRKMSRLESIASLMPNIARSSNLCYRYIDDLIVFNNKKFGDYVKEIYPSQLTVEKANTSDDLANYLELTFIIESNNPLYTNSMTNVMILISTLSMFPSFLAISHLALHIVFVFPS